MSQATENDRSAIFAEEAFVVDVQSFLHHMMDEKNFSRADLAKAMGVSRARISQIFSDECKNFTVRLLARAMHAMGEKPRVACDWSDDLDAKATQAVQKEAICAAANVHELWHNTELPEDMATPCNDDERLAGMLKLRRAA